MRACKVLSAVSLFLFMLFGTFYALLVFKPFYGIQYDVLPQIEFSGLSRSQYECYAMQIVEYFFNNEHYVSVKGKDGKKIPGYFTEEEILHMIDVKNLIRFFLFITSLSAVIFPACFKFVKNKQGLLRAVSFAGFVFVALLFLASLFDFSEAFIIFHKVFFRNSLWLLPANTKLIEMFPEEFFYDFAKVWFGTFFALCGAVYFLSFRLSNS